MVPLMLPEPWSWLIGTDSPLCADASIDGAGSPRVLVDTTASAPSVHLPAGKTTLPAVSFPFVLGGKAVQSHGLPTDPNPHRGRPDFPLPVTLGGTTVTIHQNGVVRRPRSFDYDAADPLSKAVADWIYWQVHCFRKLADLEEYPDPLFDADTHALVLRRTWQAARQVYLGTGRAEPRMALIVELSRDRQLDRTLDAISHHPRRVLQHYREDTRLDRVQELDAACIRDFARRPGITAAEKAGPKQRLLAVLRRENRDTLENRVVCWVLEEIGDLSREYCSANASFLVDPRVRQVRSFGRRGDSWRQSEWLTDTGKLHHHPESPNYPLQFEPRYKLVWKQYLRIRREKWVYDDAWAWQRILWGDTGRQLLGCCLDESFTPVAVSTPFYRRESRQGCWTEPPIAPGPFRSPWGDCFVFDSRDLDSRSGRARVSWLDNPPLDRPEFLHVGASGCDQILLWPQLNRALLVWHFYHTSLGRDEGGLRGVLERCGKALEQLTADIRRFAQSQLRLGGLLLVADLGRDATRMEKQSKPCVVLEPGPRLSFGGAVDALCLPPDADVWKRFAPDLRAGVQLVIEELLGKP